MSSFKSPGDRTEKQNEINGKTRFWGVYKLLDAGGRNRAYEMFAKTKIRKGINVFFDGRVNNLLQNGAHIDIS